MVLPRREAEQIPSRSLYHRLADTEARAAREYQVQFRLCVKVPRTAPTELGRELPDVRARLPVTWKEALVQRAMRHDRHLEILTFSAGLRQASAAVPSDHFARNANSLESAAALSAFAQNAKYERLASHAVLETHE